MSEAISETARYTGVYRSEFSGVTVGIDSDSLGKKVADQGCTKRRCKSPRNMRER